MARSHFTDVGLVLAALMFLASGSRAECVFKDGETIAFLGDSITARGWENPGGYVRLVIAGLESNGIEVTPVPAGVGSNTSSHMLARLKRDVLDKKPDWMTLSSGVNDTRVTGVPLDEYKTNVKAIIDRCQAVGIKVLILTATVVQEELDSDANAKLKPYNDFLRELAKERKCLLADLNAMFQKAIKATPNTSGKPGRLLTLDGVHMNPTGDQLMATGVLEAVGLDEPQMKKAQEAWLDLPGGLGMVRAAFNVAQGQRLEVSYPLTLRQRGKLQAAFETENKSLEGVLNAAFWADVKALLKPAGEYETAAAIFAAQKENVVQQSLQEKFTQHVETMLKTSAPQEETKNTLPTSPFIGATPTTSLLQWDNDTTDLWNGFVRHHLTIDGCHAWVVEPKKAIPGNPWTWCMKFPDAFTVRTGVLQLLDKGFFHLYMNIGNEYGSPASLKHFDAFYAAFTQKGLAKKGALVALSRGGLDAYGWARYNTDKVICIYADAPVCDFKSWPAGKGTGLGSPKDWERLPQAYGLKDEAEALAWQKNPIDSLAPIAQARIPLIHVVGDLDEAVPVAENTSILEGRYKALGGEITVIHKPAVGHHPHGLDDPRQVVELIVKYTVSCGGKDLEISRR